MKKAAIVLAGVIMASLLLGLTLVSVYPVTVAWDAGAGATSYEVVLAKEDHTGVVVQGTTATLEYTIAAVPYGRWVVGVCSVNAGGKSGYIWSDGAINPFVLIGLPAAPSNLRTK